MDRINVTKTFLPPIEEYEEYLQKIWSSGQITNQGQLLLEFEEKMKQYLGVEYFHFVSNGTIALQLALKALDISGGEVITTPFSYVATTSSVLWERCKPIFVDIEPSTMCIDTKKIEKAITEDTKAIMPVHVFGYPCNVEEINDIAERHNLKVIYDAAHAFGIKYKGKSLLSYGDISTCSFHATKSFHTIEGGCVITKSKEVSDKVDLIKRFGHNGDEHYTLGINAKSSEFQAAMGLLNLKYFEDNRRKRRELFESYQRALDKKFYIPELDKDVEHNYVYFPVVIESEKKLLSIVDALGKASIYPRRYFYPSLNELPYLESKQSCPVSEDVAKRILCLPLYSDLDLSVVESICRIMNKV